jgi:hypothetical protein
MAVEHQDAAAVEEEADIRVRPRNPLRRLRRAVRDGPPYCATFCVMVNGMESSL